MGKLNIPLHELLENSKLSEKIICRYLSKRIRRYELRRLLYSPIILGDLKLLLSSKYGLVKLLIESGANIHANHDEALRRASS